MDSQIVGREVGKGMWRDGFHFIGVEIIKRTGMIKYMTNIRIIDGIMNAIKCSYWNKLKEELNNL